MTTQPRILAFAGSTRLDSFNKKLVRIAARSARAAAASLKCTVVGPQVFPLPDMYQLAADLKTEHGVVVTG